MGMPVVYYGEKLLDYEWSSFPFDYQEFLASVYCERLRHFFRLVKVDERLDSFFHGISHTERVTFYAALMAWRQGIAPAWADIVIVAGLLHDIGRNDDGKDPEHGKRSAELLRCGNYEKIVSEFSKEHKTILLAIIENHNTQAAGSFLTMRKQYGLSPDGFVCMIKCLLILKASDGLDLIRVNTQTVRYTFDDYGKPYESFSKEVFSKYWTPPKNNIFYHLTSVDCVDSIKSSGLKASGIYFGEKTPIVFFAGSPQDCIQLAAPSETFFMANQFKNLKPTVKFTMRFAIFSVDLSGITDELTTRLSRRHDEKHYRKRWEGIYEYLLPDNVSPERITGLEYVTLTGEAPQALLEGISENRKGIVFE